MDQPFFLENSKISAGLSVLTEDVPNAGKAKRHPEQTEAIIVIQGMLCLHHGVDGTMQQTILRQGEYFLIGKGICHWNSCMDDIDAAYLFMKTNPSKEPRSEPCE